MAPCSYELWLNWFWQPATRDGLAIEANYDHKAQTSRGGILIVEK